MKAIWPYDGEGDGVARAAKSEAVRRLLLLSCRCSSTTNDSVSIHGDKTHKKSPTMSRIVVILENIRGIVYSAVARPLLTIITHRALEDAHGAEERR